MNLFINKKIWKSMNDEDLSRYKDEIFQHYRKNGFPYFKLSQNDINKEFKKLKDIDINSLIIDNDIIKQNMLCLNVANYYMKHIFHVPSLKFKSPYDAFINDDMLKKAIDKRINFGDNMSDAGMRKVLSWVSGTQKVSNFRPTVAKYFYEKYSNNGIILDFSCGFGGRLLAALSSNNVIEYHGVEPSLPTFNSLLNIKNDLNDKKIINIHQIAFEDSTFNKNYFDLSFSSPPYYNTELYIDNNEKMQSYNRYKSKNEWRDKFLKVLIQKNYDYLKDNGYFIINIANVSSYKNLENDTISITNDIGFKHIKTYKMQLSKLMGSGFKYEPIFVFKK